MIEYDFFKPRTFDIAEKLTQKSYGYKYTYRIKFMTIYVYHKSENYFDRVYKKIAKLCYDINTDTVTYVQYSTPKENGKVGLWKDIIEDLKPQDRIIVKRRTSLLINFNKLSRYFPSGNKFIYVTAESFLKVKYND